jgi:hypothetical protein
VRHPSLEILRSWDFPNGQINENTTNSAWDGIVDHYQAAAAQRNTLARQWAVQYCHFELFCSAHFDHQWRLVPETMKKEYHFLIKHAERIKSLLIRATVSNDFEAVRGIVYTSSPPEFTSYLLNYAVRFAAHKTRGSLRMLYTTKPTDAGSEKIASMRSNQQGIKGAVILALFFNHYMVNADSRVEVQKLLRYLTDDQVESILVDLGVIRSHTSRQIDVNARCGVGPAHDIGNADKLVLERASQILFFSKPPKGRWSPRQSDELFQYLSTCKTTKKPHPKITMSLCKEALSEWQQHEPVRAPERNVALSIMAPARGS